jgi:DNA-binding PadR family transcriptional regulator
MSARFGAEDILLLIADGATGSFDLDPIRLMKGGFLAWEQGPEEWKDLFAFRAYDYGPFDSRLYRARDDLISQGLMSVTRKGRYDSYALTEAGQTRVNELRYAQPENVEYLHRVGNYVTSRSFTDLLREIYAAFPEFATNSVLTR